MIQGETEQARNEPGQAQDLKAQFFRLRIRSVKLLYILQKNWTLILEQIKVDIVQA